MTNDESVELQLEKGTGGDRREQEGTGHFFGNRLGRSVYTSTASGFYIRMRRALKRFKAFKEFIREILLSAFGV